MKIIDRVYKWIDRNIFELGREIRFSYLPPLMVYVAAGVSGLTGIVGTFFVKEYLGLSAEFLAALGFWIGIPWVLKMPLGHMVDLLWKFKSILVLIGAALITTSLLIMIGLLSDPTAMRQIMPTESWFIISSLLAPVGYVIQDVVADAMTVEAVPRVNNEGQAIDKDSLRLMHTTMQTLGRVAIVSGGIFVGVLNIYMFNGADGLEEAQKIIIYTDIYQMALIIPIISILGVALGYYIKGREFRKLHQQGIDFKKAWQMVNVQQERPQANWWILGGSLVFVIFTVSMGIADIPYNQEIIFIGSMSIVLFIMSRLVKILDEGARRILIGTAIIIFVYRATPTPGAGSTWWMIDELGFDQQFFSILYLMGAVLALFGMFVFRRFLAERSIAYIIVMLTIVSTVLTLPIVGMFYDLHVWTAMHTGGVVDARFIALVDTALESPFGQIAMIPMLAWIANSAPSQLKATFFAVMASFTNLALSASQLGTKYMNQLFTVTREVKDPETKLVTTPANYDELGLLLITVSILVFAMPIVAILIIKRTRLHSA